MEASNAVTSGAIMCRCRLVAMTSHMGFEEEVKGLVLAQDYQRGPKRLQTLPVVPSESARAR